MSLRVGGELVIINVQRKTMNVRKYLPSLQCMDYQHHQTDVKEQSEMTLQVNVEWE